MTIIRKTSQVKWSCVSLRCCCDRPGATGAADNQHVCWWLLWVHLWQHHPRSVFLMVQHNCIIPILKWTYQVRSPYRSSDGVGYSQGCSSMWDWFLFNLFNKWHNSQELIIMIDATKSMTPQFSHAFQCKYHVQAFHSSMTNSLDSYSIKNKMVSSYLFFCFIPHSSTSHRHQTWAGHHLMEQGSRGGLKHHHWEWWGVRPALWPQRSLLLLVLRAICPLLPFSKQQPVWGHPRELRFSGRSQGFRQEGLHTYHSLSGLLIAVAAPCGLGWNGNSGRWLGHLIQLERIPGQMCFARVNRIFYTAFRFCILNGHLPSLCPGITECYLDSFLL